MEKYDKISKYTFSACYTEQSPNKLIPIFKEHDVSTIRKNRGVYFEGINIGKEM